MRSFILLTVIITTVILSVAGGPCSSNNESQLVCLQNTTGPQHRSAVYSSFSFSQQIDLVFLVDTSPSISEPLFNSVKTFLLNYLFPFLRSTGSFYVGRDYTRVTALTFGFNNVPQFSSLSCSDNGITACDIEEKINAMLYQKDGPQTTELTGALNDVRDIFADPKNRNSASKILWVFTDGQIGDANANVKLNLSCVEPLRQLGVKIFSVGIGRCPSGWFTKVLYEDNLKSLATPDDGDSYYACIENWTQFLANSSSGGSSSTAVGVDPIGANNLNPCQTCSRQNIPCVCNLADVTHTPTCENITRRVDLCSGPTTTTGTGNPSIEKSWLINILVPVICGVLALIVLIIILVVVIRRCKDCKPRLPKPPPPPRRHRLAVGDEGVYNNESSRTASNGRTCSVITDIAAIGEVGSVRDMIRVERSESCRTDNRMSWITEFTDTSSVRELTIERDTTYSNITELNAPIGWDEYLTNGVHIHNFDSLSIQTIPATITIGGASWSASSPNFNTTRSELFSITKLMRSSGSMQMNSVHELRVGSQSFRTRMHLDDLSENHLHGVRETGCGQLSLRIVKSNGYLVIGIAPSRLDSDLESFVYEISMTLDSGRQ